MPDQTIRYRDGHGYDHPHYDWDPLHRRTPLIWPDNKQIAVSAHVYLEYMELDPPEDAIADARFASALGSYFPDFQNYSRREFGNRVGIFRVLEILERYGLRDYLRQCDGCQALPLSDRALPKGGTSFCRPRLVVKPDDYVENERGGRASAYCRLLRLPRDSAR